MTTLPRTLSLLAARILLGVAALSLTLLAAWSASDLWGQPSARANAAFAQKKPRVEEEEETPKKTPPKKPRAKEEEEEATKAKTPPNKKPRAEEEETAPKAKPKRKVIRVEEEEGPVVQPGDARPEAPAVGDLRQLADQAKHPGARSLFVELAVPHDRIVLKKNEGVTINGSSRQSQYDVEPIPVYLGTDPGRYRKPLTLHLLTNGKRDKAYNPRPASLEYVRSYEELAQSEVSQFLKERYDLKPRQSNDYLSRFDMLLVAKQALSAVLRWHESARETGRRTGKEWEAIETGLRKRLLDDVLLKQMEVLVDSRDWDKVVALARQLAVIYTDKADRERIARPVADMIENALKDDPTASDEKKPQARKRLLELERDFPDNEVFKPIIDGLQKQAQTLLEQARKLAEGKSDPDKERRIGMLLRQAEEIWPQLQGLHTFKLERSVEHPVLRVGVRGPLPKYLSPAWACTDAEQRAVELLFESLVKVIPDADGVFRYHPGLAEQRPKVTSLGRRFQLPRGARWSNNQRLDAGDIRATVRQLKAGVGLGRSRAWGELLDRVEVKSDPYQVTLRLHQGYLDPLALMTFKILPQGQPVDTEEFATKPVSSGPFRFAGQRSDEDNRECAFFLANPSYNGRSGKRDLPRIQEIRFYSYVDPVGDLTSGKLDLALDLTAEETQKLRQKSSEAGIEVPTASARMPNRRIYFLAINQSKLPSAALRKALAYAINREQLLKDHFRGPLERDVHKALNGPFPAGSWACNPNLTSRRGKGSLDLFDADKAGTLCPPKQGAAVGPLKLKYPQGDPALEKAMKDLCERVKTLTGLVLEPAPCDPYQLREDVEQTQSYDVAYYHYDFPDDTYWLWPLLGPPLRERADSNIFKFTDITIQPALKAAMSYRDFAEVRKHQWAVHESLLGEMPFIPLWQLDPLLAYGRAVQPAALDPVLVFTNIEEWRLRRK